MTPATSAVAEKQHMPVSSSTFIWKDDAAAAPIYNPDNYWGATQQSYAHYPTVRHRKRFIFNVLRKKSRAAPLSVFDFGCGEGTLLKDIQQSFGLSKNDVGGCDISGKAVEIARSKIQSPHLYHELYPNIADKFDVVICSEVIEHTRAYEAIIRWMRDHLKKNGLMILTTQSGPIHGSDRYTGHTQHFKLNELVALLKTMGLRIRIAREWGFPFFTIQKYLTDRKFEHIQNAYLEGKMSAWKRFVFNTAYVLHFLHDLVPVGPQLYIVAEIEEPV